MTDKGIDTDDEKAWWKETKYRDHKAGWLEAIDQFIEMQDLEIEDVAVTQELIKNMLPIIATKDKRWKKFKFENFNTDKYPMHNALWVTARTRIENLQNEAEKQRKADEKAEEQKRVAAAKQKEKDQKQQKLERLSNRSSVAPVRGRRKVSANSAPHSSSQSSKKNKVTAFEEKPFESNNGLQSSIAKDPDGKIIIQTKEGQLERAWQYFKLKKREAKYAEKEFKRIQEQSYFISEPILTDDEKEEEQD